MSEEDFVVLYNATAKPLWRYVSRVTGRRDIADDVLQETYLRFLGSERTGLRLEEVRPYLFRIATNLLHDRWRRGDDVLFSQVEEAVISTDAEGAVDTLHMLRRLKPRSRELLWLAYMEGMTHREIANVTGLSTMSVRVLLSRARHAAMKLLEPGRRSYEK
jgi:RNA polymerase sigma-70 factor (ECF subfamily)